VVNLHCGPYEGALLREEEILDVVYTKKGTSNVFYHHTFIIPSTTIILIGSSQRWITVGHKDNLVFLGLVETHSMELNGSKV
jgi:hypothetical protein